MRVPVQPGNMGSLPLPRSTVVLYPGKMGEFPLALCVLAVHVFICPHVAGVRLHVTYYCYLSSPNYLAKVVSSTLPILSIAK